MKGVCLLQKSTFQRVNNKSADKTARIVHVNWCSNRLSKTLDFYIWASWHFAQIC